MKYEEFERRILGEAIVAPIDRSLVRGYVNNLYQKVNGPNLSEDSFNLILEGFNTGRMVALLAERANAVERAGKNLKSRF